MQIGIIGNPKGHGCGFCGGGVWGRLRTTAVAPIDKLKGRGIIGVGVNGSKRVRTPVSTRSFGGVVLLLEDDLTGHVLQLVQLRLSRFP